MVDREEEEKVDEYLHALITAYIIALSNTALSVGISGGYYALKELNRVREKAGLGAVPIDLKQITIAAKNQSEEYRRTLELQGGSEVVQVVGDTEKLVFTPWLKDLEVSTKNKVITTMDQGISENWTSQMIRDKLNNILVGNSHFRAKNAAFTEMRVQQFKAQVSAWKSGGLGYVQRHCVRSGNTCSTCIEMDEKIYPIDLAPPLSHIACKCWYSPYLPKSGEIKEEL